MILLQHLDSHLGSLALLNGKYASVESKYGVLVDIDNWMHNLSADQKDYTVAVRSKDALDSLAAQLIQRVLAAGRLLIESWASILEKALQASL